tara:strand:+ start:118 stop:834 length:717 start_codon:yes stop_codon:yes gene_type:complete
MKTKPIVYKKNNEEIYRYDIFSVRYWAFKLNDVDTDRLKLIEETYRLKNENPKGIQRSNYGGWHSENDLHKNNVFKKLNNKIIKIVESSILSEPAFKSLHNIYNNQHGPWKSTKFKLDAGWATVNNDGDRNFVHTHEDSFLSCAFYLKVPDTDTLWNNKNASSRIGTFVFKDPIGVRKHSGMLFGKKNDYYIEPEEGLLLIFPSWLAHEVRPHYLSEDRISYSCNIEYPYVDEEQYGK